MTECPSWLIAAPSHEGAAILFSNVPSSAWLNRDISGPAKALGLSFLPGALSVCASVRSTEAQTEKAPILVPLSNNLRLP